MDDPEPADDMEEVSRTTSGDGAAYGDGDFVCSSANLGAGFPCCSDKIEVGGAACDRGKVGMLESGVGAGVGGWSESDGTEVLIVNQNVAPLPGSPLAFMSPPCK